MTKNGGGNTCSSTPRSSIELRTMFGIIGEQLDTLDEKSVIFADSPFEQQLYVTVLRLFNVKAEGILATMAQADKENLIREFQSPLARWNRPGFYDVLAVDIEVIVLSYYVNSGLNLHNHCRNLHAPSPPPSQNVVREVYTQL
jgi:hypothetical protein